MDEPSCAALWSARMTKVVDRGFVWMFVFSERCVFYGASRICWAFRESDSKEAVKA